MNSLPRKDAASAAGARSPAAPDPLEFRREARLRVFRGEDPLIGFSPLVGYGLIFLVFAIVIALGAKVNVTLP
jgi:hypothetical protein